MGPARRERGRREAQLRPRSSDLLPAEDLAVELPRPLQVADIQHQVAELFDLHANTSHSMVGYFGASLRNRIVRGMVSRDQRPAQEAGEGESQSTQIRGRPPSL